MLVVSTEVNMFIVNVLNRTNARGFITGPFSSQADAFIWLTQAKCELRSDGKIWDTPGGAEAMIQPLLDPVMAAQGSGQAKPVSSHVR